MKVCYSPEMIAAWPRAMAEIGGPRRLAERSGISYSTCCRIVKSDPETLEMKPGIADKLRPLILQYVNAAPVPPDGNTQIPQIARESVLIDLIDTELAKMPPERLAAIYRAIVTDTI